MLAERDDYQDEYANEQEEVYQDDYQQDEYYSENQVLDNEQENYYDKPDMQLEQHNYNF